jgi:hypothetical protein
MPVPPSPPDHNQHGECSDSRANPVERLIPVPTPDHSRPRNHRSGPEERPERDSNARPTA